MKLETYLQAIKRTDTDLGSEEKNNNHMLMGLSTEVGELIDVFKRQLAYGKPLDNVNIKEEIGDIMWYLGNLCNQRGYSLEECMGMNITKLYKRYPDKFSADNALVRDLEAERKVLEAGEVHDVEINLNIEKSN